jgi:hypothetical protein
MAEISAAAWAQLVADYEAAERSADAAYRACETAPDAFKPQMQADYERLGRVRDRCEEALLSVEAPTIEGAAYQLRLFAMGYHFTDPAEAPAVEDEQEAGVLRRIYTGLNKLAAAPRDAA